jgi:serine/threonine protein kinase
VAGFPDEGATYAGRYRVVRELGHGRSGTVYEAHDPVLDRPVALTVVVPSLADRGGYQQRFAREAAALARIRSRHVVGIHEYGEHDGTVYAVTEYFPDGDLEQWLATHGPLDRGTALRLVAEVCQGLADSHDVGVVHGDVRPEAVLLWQRPEGLVPYLRDLGVVGGNEQHLAPDGAMVGTPAWMPPERHFGHPADERGDVYGAGCLLWAALTGRAPYDGTDFETVNAHINDPLPRLGGDDPVDARIDEVLAAAMAKSPDERIGSPSELRVRLLRVLHELQAAREPDPPGDAPASRTLVWALVFVVLAVAVGVGALLVA